MIAYIKSRVGYHLNHKGVWYTLTGYFNGGYWQAISPTGAATWVKHDLSYGNPVYINDGEVLNHDYMR